MRFLLLAIVCCAALPAQQGLPGIAQPPLLPLKEYLQLTDSQYATLFQNMAQYQRTIGERQMRVATVRREIAEETARENPSPMELGTRYAEIEFICRSLESEGKQLADRNRALLTDPQKARLKSLDDAMKLYPTIAQAQQVKLLDDSAPISIFTAPLVGTGGFILTNTSGCSVQFPTGIRPATP